MKVSIITSCYNRENTIADAIKSVFSQDYQNIEYIIIDGASKDRSVDIIKETVLSVKNATFIKDCLTLDKNTLVKNSLIWRDGFSVVSCGKTLNFQLISEPDRGMYEAINKGILMASGDIIGLVHSDDFLYDRSVISDYVKKFEMGEYDFVYADGIFVNQNNVEKIVRYWVSGTFRYWKLRCGWLPLHPTAYIKKDVFERLGYYDENYKIAADSDLMLRFLLQNKLKIGYMRKRNTIRMRMGGLSTDRKRRRQMWKEDLSVYSSFGFLLPRVVKLMKISWKIPQFIKAWLYHFEKVV